MTGTAAHILVNKKFFANSLKFLWRLGCFNSNKTIDFAAHPYCDPVFFKQFL